MVTDKYRVMIVALFQVGDVSVTLIPFPHVSVTVKSAEYAFCAAFLSVNRVNVVSVFASSLIDGDVVACDNFCP